MVAEDVRPHFRRHFTMCRFRVKLPSCSLAFVVAPNAPAAWAMALTMVLTGCSAAGTEQANELPAQSPIITPSSDHHEDVQADSIDASETPVATEPVAIPTAAASAPAASPPRFAGPFAMRQHLVFHVVNASGEPFNINLRWSDPQRASMDRPILVRIYDPDEHLLLRHDAPGEMSDQIEQNLSLDVPSRGKGVYQIAIDGFRPLIHFDTEPAMSFGVFAYPDLAVRDDQFANAFIHIPQTLDSLNVRGGEALQSVRISDDSDAARINFAGASAGSTSVVPDEHDRIWRLAARARGEGTLNFSGMPIILCPDEASARAIRSSIDVLDDGTICFHKFQVRAHEILNRYRAMPPSALAVQPPVLVRYKQAWLSDPVRNRLLLGAYGVYSGLDAVLSEQVLDAGSPWFGCIAAHRDQGGRLREGDPWKRLDRLGLSRVATTVSTLAAVYGIREPFNPLSGSESLRNRIIIAALQELMLLREHELPMPEFIEYPGGERSFLFANFAFSFPLVVRDCPDDVRSVWTEGLRRFVDHQMYGVVNNTVNQWTFTIRGVQHFAEGVDDPFYSEIVRRSLRWLLTRNQHGWGFMEAGYFAESGPDATYNGISLHNLGWVYRRTNDAELRESLRRCFDLFNHTVAPEPDGSWQEATNFASRTPGGWIRPQWTAGASMLAGEITEAVPLLGRAWMSVVLPTDAASLRSAEAETTAGLEFVRRSAFRDFGEGVLRDAADIGFLAWQAHADRTLAGQLPVTESNDFTRVFGTEFMCVRRPSYYTFLYAGSPMADWQKRARSGDPLQQHPRNGGGLSMFWSPNFGVSLLAKNWSAYAANTIVIERAGGADWEDYWTVQPELYAETASASVSAGVLNHPVRVQRDWRFMQDVVECTLTLSVTTAANGGMEAHVGRWECFPYSLDKPRRLRITPLDANGMPLDREQPVHAILFEAPGTPGGEAHLLVFDQPRICRFEIARSTDHYGGKREHGSILAAFPDMREAGATRVRWRIMSVRAVEAAQRVQEAIVAMKQG